MPATFINLASHDRVDHDSKVVYTSPKPGAPPVPTTYWDADAWRRWGEACDRVRKLQTEAEAAGYRVVAV